MEKIFQLKANGTTGVDTITGATKPLAPPSDWILRNASTSQPSNATAIVVIRSRTTASKRISLLFFITNPFLPSCAAASTRWAR